MNLFNTIKQKPYIEIEAVKNKIIDNSLIIGSVLGLFTLIVSANSTFMEFVIVGCFGLVAAFRNYLRVEIKSIIIVMGILAIVLFDVFLYGILSNNKILIVLIPLFSFLGFSLRYTIIIYTLTIFSFLFLGYLFISGIIVSNTIVLQRTLTIELWVTIALLISIVSLVVIIIIEKFNNTYLRLISDLKNKNIEITEKERNYREIFNSSTDAIFIHGLDGKIIDVNNAMLNMYAYQNSEISSINVEDLSSGIEPYNAEKSWVFIKNAIQNGKQVFDWHARKKTGELFWVEVALKKVNIGGEERVLAVVRDINEKKQTAIELEKYKNHLEILVKDRTNELETTNEELKSINEELYSQREKLEATINKLRSTQESLIQAEKMASIGVLASGVAHEINNPLNFIQGGINGVEIYLEENFDKNHLSEIAPLLNGMKEGIKRAARIVTSLGHFSRIDKSNTEKCDIHDIIDNCLVILKNKLKNKVDIKRNYTKTSFVLKGNEGRLHQAILNILSNADQAIENKGTIKISTIIEEQNILVSVNDSGSGISKDIISRISDPFFTTKEVGKGTGLGLAITYKIIEEHKGTIKYLSEEGKGTEVIILLPIKL